MHFGPPGVVSVVDDEEHLAPEQHQWGVCGDELHHQAIKPFQGVEISSLSPLHLQQSAACSRDAPEHSWTQHVGWGKRWLQDKSCNTEQIKYE